MVGRAVLVSVVFVATLVAAGGLTPAEAQVGGHGQPTDWNRFYYYPYVYYPHSFQRPQSFDHLYYRYPQERRIPVYNENWHNFYPTSRPYHKGHHFILDVF